MTTGIPDPKFDVKIEPYPFGMTKQEQVDRIRELNKNDDKVFATFMGILKDVLIDIENGTQKGVT
jgi:hypothetical protein